MKKIIMLLGLVALVSVKSFAQFDMDSSKIRCTYSLVYFPDSADLQNERYEKMLLFVSDTVSLFESEGKWLDDSLDINRKVTSDSVTFTASDMVRFSNFHFMIFKNGCNNIKDVEQIAHDHFAYKESKPIEWHITEETKNINGYDCQKAVCKLGGRDWTAWFTTDIPISEGPYKFCWLPGLVVRISDTQNFFNFTLLSCINKKEKIFIVKNANAEHALLETSKKRYFMVLSEYRHDPMSFERRGIHIISGKDVIAQRVKEHIRVNNNYIERGAD